MFRLAQWVACRACDAVRKAIAFSAFALLASAVEAQDTTAEQQLLQAINARFNQIATLQGQFVQYGPGASDQLTGSFYFARPGLLRLEYDPPSSQLIVSNGTTVMIRDRQRGTENFERLDRTPLAPLFAANTDLTSSRLVDDIILDLGGFTAVVMAPAINRSSLTLYFDPRTHELRSWLTTDARGNRISFVMFDTLTNEPLAPELFTIAD